MLVYNKGGDNMVLYHINKVALYCSDIGPLEISIEEQKKRLEKYCRHFDLEIVKEYIDYDKGSEKYFNQMIDDIKNKEFNIVLSYSFLNFNENVYNVLDLIRELKNYDYELHIENTYKYSPIAKPLFKMPRSESKKEEIKNKRNTDKIPVIIRIQERNPVMDEPINWVKKLNDKNIYFEDRELFDTETGEFLGYKTDVYITLGRFAGYYNPKKRKQCGALKERPLW